MTVELKLHMQSGAILYRKDISITAFRSRVNGANSKGSAVCTGHSDAGFTNEVQIQMTNIEYFEEA